MWQFNPYAFPLALSTIPLAAFFYAAWPRRSELTVKVFLVFVGMLFLLMFAYTGEQLSTTLPAILFWNRVEYLFLPIAVVYLMLVFAYTGREEWITPSRIVPLLIIPVMQTLAAWTNDFHHLNWATVGVAQVGSIRLFERTYGPIFYIGMIYVYSVTIIACTLLIAAVVRAPAPQRRQMWPLLLTAVFPLTAQTLTVMRVTPIPNLDLTPFGFALSVMPIGWGLFRERLFEMVPAAHDLVIMSMSDALLVLDARQRVVDANPAAEHLLMMPASAIVGKPISELLSTLPPISEIARKITKAEIVCERDGVTRIYDAQISPLRTVRDSLRGQVIVLRDVTAVKEGEQALQQAMGALERRNQELDAYDHTVAHDLRGPITIMAGYADLILTGHETLPPDLARHLTHMQNAALKMNDIVGSLLLLASMRDAGSALAPVDMAPVIRAAIERLEAKIAERGVELEVSSNLPTVHGQAAWLEEVFTNLIDNAVKYIGHTNPSPRIRVRGYEQNGKARFEVEDNGVGIAPEVVPQLFEMFTRAHPDEAEGAGLGLSIVRQIMHKLNGEVGVESRPGNGSTFWLALPLA